MGEDPVAVCNAANAAAKERYAGKDVAGMLAVAEAGFARATADAAAHPDLAPAVRRAAKVLAYNAAANCWPGWGDEGIAIDAASLARGLALAERSRALVVELGLGEQETGRADWLLGALRMAAGQHAAALYAFAQARAAFQAGNVPTQALMAEGYHALARKCAAPQDRAAAAEFAACCARLAEAGGKEAGFFHRQLLTADRIFIP
jgi:hypothetical protein